MAAILTMAAVFVIPSFSGCASSAPTTQPMSEDEKQDAILKDPMDYKPQIDRSVTGGDDNTTHLGRGIGSDLNDLVNP
jgi:hypothetical protein